MQPRFEATCAHMNGPVEGGCAAALERVGDPEAGDDASAQHPAQGVAAEAVVWVVQVVGVDEGDACDFVLF